MVDLFKNLKFSILLSMHLCGKHNYALTNPKKGFCAWKHLNLCIPTHENSPEHRECYSKWKMMEKSLKDGEVIGTELEKVINTEEEKW